MNLKKIEIHPCIKIIIFITICSLSIPLFCITVSDSTYIMSRYNILITYPDGTEENFQNCIGYGVFKDYIRIEINENNIKRINGYSKFEIDEIRIRKKFNE